MFEVVILVCSFGLSPAACQEDNALDVIRAPAAAGNMMNCGLYGQAFVAQSSLAKRLDGTYLKIRCGGGRRDSDEASAKSRVTAGPPPF